jgi:hypothetical protein
MLAYFFQNCVQFLFLPLLDFTTHLLTYLTSLIVSLLLSLPLCPDGVRTDGRRTGRRWSEVRGADLEDVQRQE